MKYWVYINGQSVGPYELDKLVSVPGFDGSCRVYLEGPENSSREWKRADEVAEIRGLLTGAAAPSAPASFGSTDLVVLDDDDAICDIVLTSMTDAGYVVAVRQNSHGFLDFLREKRPRIILTDIRMPGLDGIGVCKAIKSDPLLSSSKVIVLSAFAGEELQASALRHGADAFVDKPFIPAELVDKVGKLIGAPVPRARADQPRRRASEDASVTALGTGSSREGYCIVIEGAERMFVLDGGMALASLAVGAVKNVCILLSNFAPGKVEGLAAWAANLPRDCSVDIFAPRDLDTSFEDFVERHFSPAVRGRLRWQYLVEGRRALGSSFLTVVYSNAPLMSLTMRLEIGSKVLVYAPDSEVPRAEDLNMKDYKIKLAKLCRGADVLIHDARYAPQEYEAHRQEGRSAYPAVLQLALDTGVRSVGLLGLEDRAKLPALEKGIGDVLGEELTTLECRYLRSGDKLVL